MSIKQKDLALKPHVGWAGAFRAAFPRTLPVLTGYAFLGMAFGILMRTKGYGPLWSGLMSALAFGGSIQYAAVALLTTAFDPLQALLLSLMVNARHLFYGIAMLQKYRGAGRLKPALIFLLTDETFSVNCAASVLPGVKPAQFYFAASVLDYLYWVLASIAGGFLGGVLPFDTTGIDFALTALFVVIWLEQLKQRENRIPAAVGACCSAACLWLFGAESFIIPSMVAIMALLLALAKPLGGSMEDSAKEESSCT